MTDHMSAGARLLAAMHVCEEQPDWRLELLTTLCVTLALALLVTFNLITVAVAERDVAAFERDRWMQLARAEDRRATVRLSHDGKQFRCEHFNIRREWEVAVAAECEVLGGLLQLARTTP